jgi:hypothetical protein
MFDVTRATATPRHAQVDFCAALAFIVGSALFFSPAYSIPATWLFLVGSLLVAARPTVTVARELHLARLPHPHLDHAPRDVGAHPSPDR